MAIAVTILSFVSISFCFCFVCTNSFELHRRTPADEDEAVIVKKVSRIEEDA